MRFLAKLLVLAMYLLPDSISAAQNHCHHYFSRIIAEAPADAMGSDFYKLFGTIMSEHRARPGNMLQLATMFFQNRLGLAKKYNTWFATQMEPHWELPSQPQIRRWRERFTGSTKENAWSFGIRDHERANPLFDLLERTLDLASAKMEPIDPEGIPMVPGMPKLRDGQMLPTWTYVLDLSTDSAGGPQRLEFKTYCASVDAYVLLHPKDHLVPLALQEAQRSWDKVFAKGLSDVERVEAVARFEWIWFWTNPFGRSGALTGDGMSLLLQQHLKDDGIGLKMREDYLNQDLVAFQMPILDYVTLRTTELLSLP